MWSSNWIRNLVLIALWLGLAAVLYFSYRWADTALKSAYNNPNQFGTASFDGTVDVYGKDGNIHTVDGANVVEFCEGVLGIR